MIHKSTSFSVTMWSYLHIITFIILCFTAECGARVHVIYKPIGDEAHLTLKEYWNTNRGVKWRKDNYLIAFVLNQMISVKNQEKFKVGASDNSLFIYNLTVRDSGEYRALIGQWENEEIQYKLIVEEVVSQPVINTSLNLQSNSSSVCQILVKCSADGDSVTYNCDHQHCNRTNNVFTRVNITVNVRDDEVLECTASNHTTEKYQENKCVNSVVTEVGKPQKVETLEHRITAQNETTIYTFPFICKM